MDIDPLLERQPALLLAEAIRRQLAQAAAIHLPPRHILGQPILFDAVTSGPISITRIATGTTTAIECFFYIPNNWIACVPKAFARAKWIRRELDWHVFPSTGCLCFEFFGRWGHILPDIRRLNTLDSTALFAATWCINSLRWLLEKHLLGSDFGLDKWQEEWVDWPHPIDQATREFQIELSRKAA